MASMTFSTSMVAPRHAPNASGRASAGPSGQHFSAGKSELFMCGRPVNTGMHALQAGTRSTRQACGATGTQMNLFSRFGRVIKSYANGVVSSAEDPEKILDQAVQDMNADLIKLRQATAKVIASQKQLEAKYNQARTTADEWYARAELALSKGEEALAKEALQRRKTYQQQAEQWEGQLSGQKKAVEQLMGNTKVLEGKLQEAKAKKDTLKARAASAKSTREINDMLGGIGDGSNSYAAFEKMEEKVIAMEAESEASIMLNPAKDDLESKFAMLEGGGVDSELEAMKKKMAGGSSGGELPAGRPIRDAIDLELEELRQKAKDNK